MNKQVLKTRLIGDSEISISLVVLDRTEKTMVVLSENGEVIRTKIRKSFDGREYIMPFGNYSMSPIFNL
jgi:hypothetical protein